MDNRESNNVKRYTGKNAHEKMRRIKALILAGLLTITGGTLYGIGHHNGYEKASNEYIELIDDSTEKLEEEIEKTIKAEYAEAKGVNIDEVEIEYESIGSSLKRTEIRDNSNSYTYNNELRDPVGSGNLKAKHYRGLIENYIAAVNRGASKKELVELLKETKEKTDKYDLKVDDKGNLRETRVEEDER